MIGTTPVPGPSGAIARSMAAERLAAVGWPTNGVTLWIPDISAHSGSIPVAVRTTGMSGWISRMRSMRAFAPSGSPVTKASYRSTSASSA